ncbi:hypothetical protein LENED_003842 [Lentinula edodes]|uniref:Uncharacterized protein n=1 Tax=Lentinula edodes TaxID=5353 RepID=A0A1Q3E4N7_LENED|nr:hypothetical protein LENED_003842 [Lentinula edodes]
MNMTPGDYSRLQQTLHGNFFYLGREGPFPDGCGWFVLDGKKTYCAPLTAGQEAPSSIPFQIVGRVGTNLNNTGIFGGWTPTGQYPPNNSRRTFQLGPPLAGVFRNDWIAAITKLKEIQTAGANNTRKVRYLFVHENVPPLDSLVRMGSKVFRDLDDGEGPDDLLYSSIPKNKREDADWTDIRLTKGLAPFPLFGMNDELIPLARARSVIGGATVRVTFSLRCWRYNPNEPFSFAADVVRVDLLSTPQDNGSPQIGLLLTPPTTPQNSLNRSNGIVGESGNTPSYRSQPLFAFENSNGTPQGDSSLLATVSLNGSPQTPTGSGSRYNIGNYTSPTRNDMLAGASPYQGMIQQHLNGDAKPHRVLGAAFENTDVNFSTGNIGNQTGGAVERFYGNPPPVNTHFSGASPGMNRSGHGYGPEYYAYEGGADGNTGNSMYGMQGGTLHDKVYDHDKNFTPQDPASVPVKNTMVTTHDTSKLVHNFGNTVSSETDGGRREPGTDENTLDCTTVDDQRISQISELKVPGRVKQLQQPPL